ncbi:uncharacterized protein LOC112568896 [Pomacea canaliculata]|uniref:uncharacterized protein LOC112568896 n=1 Tax=Pomacea canaliculata TaxID=400727 RepID=UPI000D736223|nr:uncharacterized protein LOC112568896 [Pomacea canaliculata]
MTAYPTPGIKNITYLGANETDDGRPVQENFVQMECSASPLAPAAVSCKIRVVNLTPSHRGFYRVIFTNSFGELPFVFFVKDLTDQEQHAKVQDYSIPSVAGGISAGFLALVLITITVILWRRWRSKRNDRSREENQASANISNQSLTNVTIQKTSTTEGQETAPYDELQLEDVGMSSHYEKLQQDIDPSKVVSQSSPANKTYESLDSTDIEPAYYDQLTNSQNIRNLKYKGILK